MTYPERSTIDRLCDDNTRLRDEAERLTREHEHAKAYIQEA